MKALILLLLLLSSGRAADREFRLVADDWISIPDQLLAFFNSISTATQVGDAVFFASGPDATGVIANVYEWREGRLSTRFNSFEHGQTFTQTVTDLCVDETGISFQSGKSIWDVRNGKTNRVISIGDPLPGNPSLKIERFGPLVRRAGKVYVNLDPGRFRAGYCCQDIAAMWDGETLTPIYIAEGSATAAQRRYVVIAAEGEKLALEIDTTQGAILAYSTNLGPPQNLSGPHAYRAGPGFDPVRCAMFHDRIAFTYEDSPSFVRAVAEIQFDGAFQSVAKVGDLTADGQQITGFVPEAKLGYLTDGSLIFTASTWYGFAVLRWRDGERTVIVKRGDTIGGKWITNLTLESVSGDHILIRVFFDDGRTALYTTAPGAPRTPTRLQMVLTENGFHLDWFGGRAQVSTDLMYWSDFQRTPFAAPIDTRTGPPRYFRVYNP